MPQGKAYEVTPVTLKRINQLKTKRAEREGAERNAAEELARRINKLTLNLTLETGGDRQGVWLDFDPRYRRGPQEGTA